MINSAIKKNNVLVKPRIAITFEPVFRLIQPNKQRSSELMVVWVLCVYYLMNLFECAFFLKMNY